MEGLTTNEAAAAGAIIGVGIGFVLLFIVIFYLLTVIACWKMFTKAGEAGWKSLIPIYNLYVLYKISGVSFWTWFFIPVIVASICSGIAQANGDFSWFWLLLYLVIMIAVDIKISVALSKAFGKGTGFAVGLFFFPNIFQLILGLGSAQYQGNTTK